jgi:cytidine deaminase
MPQIIDDETWFCLADTAWDCRAHAYLLGKTAVGAAALAENGDVCGGCNLEHPWRISIHAEVNALAGLMSESGPDLRVIAVLIVAERELFTPCGGCLDWIFELGGPECIVAHQAARGGPIQQWRAAELMPHYPR